MSIISKLQMNHLQLVLIKKTNILDALKGIACLLRLIE